MPEPGGFDLYYCRPDANDRIQASVGSSFVAGKNPGDGSASIHVDCVGINDFIRSLDRRVSLIKMDIEGAEQTLFDQPWHPELRFLVLELHPPRYSDKVIKRIVDCMSDSGLTYDPAVSRGRILGFRRVPKRG